MLNYNLHIGVNYNPSKHGIQLILVICFVHHFTWKLLYFLGFCITNMNMNKWVDITNDPPLGIIKV